jgi:hypothetical protein
VWRVESKEDEDFLAPISQVEVIQGVATTQEVSLTNEANSCSMEARESREGSQE